MPFPRWGSRWGASARENNGPLAGCVVVWDEALGQRAGRGLACGSSFTHTQKKRIWSFLNLQGEEYDLAFSCKRPKNSFREKKVIFLSFVGEISY